MEILHNCLSVITHMFPDPPTGSGPVGRDSSIAKPLSRRTWWMALCGICRPYLRSIIFSRRLAPEFCSLWISRINRLSASLRCIFRRPNFFDANGSLFFFIQCSQTRFTVRILTFISAAMILELMLLVFTLIIYLALAAVSLKLCSFCPCTYRIEVNEYINAKLLGFYTYFFGSHLLYTRVCRRHLLGDMDAKNTWKGRQVLW